MSGSEASTWASSTRSLNPPERTRERLLVDVGRDAQPLEDLGGARLERVAVVVEDELLDVGVAVGVEIAIHVGEQALALFERVPDVLLAHHRHVDDRHVLVLEVVLLQDAQAGAPRHVDDAVRGDLVAGEDLEERRLAGAVGADEAVAGAGVELEGGALEQGVAAEGFGQVGDRNHGTEEFISRGPVGPPAQAIREKAQVRMSAKSRGFRVHRVASSAIAWAAIARSISRPRGRESAR